MQPALRAAFDAGVLAQTMVSGYYSLHAALTVARNPDSLKFARSRNRNLSSVATGRLERRDGAAHEYNLHHYLSRLQSNPSEPEAVERAWLSGAILQLGEVFAQHQYFDRSPELELVRHLRNAIAHGNVFRIERKADLVAHPAHNKQMTAAHRGCRQLVIDQSLNGTPVLFDYIDRAELLDLLVWIGFRLQHYARSSTTPVSPTDA